MATVSSGKFTVLNKKTGLYSFLKDEGASDAAIKAIVTTNLVASLNNGWVFNNKTYFWHNYLNWLFKANTLPSGCEVQFPAGTIKLKQTINITRGDEAGDDGNKYPISLIGSGRGKTMTTFEFDHDSDYGLYSKKSITLTTIKFKGNDIKKSLVKVEVKRPASNDNEDDTDSQIKGCRFQNFKATALEFNGRNTKVSECKFKGNGTVGIWHYFNDILEDPDKDGNQARGVCRKNRIFNCTFELDADSYSIRLGRMPGDDGSDKKYSHYNGFAILDNTVEEGRFLKIVGGKVNNNIQKVDGLTIQNNKVKKNKDRTKGSIIDASDCSLSMVVADTSFDGGNKADHAIYLDDSVESSTMVVNADFKNYKQQAIVIGEQGDKIEGVLLTGEISGDYSGKDGVACFKRRNLVTFDSDFNQMRKNSNGSPIDSNWTTAPNDPNSIGQPKNGTPIEEVWKAKGSKTVNYTNGKGKTTTLNDYTDALNAIGSESQYKNKTFYIQNRCIVTGQVTINQPVTFSSSTSGERNNIVFWSSKIQGNREARFGMTVNANTDFYKVGFSSTAVDGGKRKQVDSWYGEEGCNLIDIKKGGNKSRFEKCGIAGFNKGKIAIRWDVAGNGQVSLLNSNFKDAVAGVCLHIHSTENQTSSNWNYIHSNVFHIGSSATPIIVGNVEFKFETFTGCKNIGKVSIYNNLLDLGGFLFGSKIDKKSMGTVKIIKTNFSGGVRVNDNVNATVDFVNGTYDNIYISDNIFSTAQSEAFDKADFVAIRKGTQLSSNSSEIAIVTSLFAIDDIAKKDSYALGISEDILDSHANKVHIYGVFNGEQGKNTGDNSIKILKNSNPNSGSNRQNIDGNYTLGTYTVTGQQI